MVEWDNRACAVAFLRGYFSEDVDTSMLIQNAICNDPKDWWVGYHFHWGMAVRNLLRKHGYGEDQLKVTTLDDHYVSIVEEALLGK